MKLELVSRLRPQSLSEMNPLITAAATLALVACSLLAGRPGAAAPPPPISGVLYSAAADTAPAATDGSAFQLAAPAYPELRLSVAPPARGRFPVGSNFLVRIVDHEASTFSVTLANLSAMPSPRRASPRRTASPEPPPAAPPAPPPPSEPMVHEPAAPAKASQPATFIEIDEALQASPTTETINLRTKRAGVTFRATHVGRVGERAVVRFAIANEEASDFFLSIVNARVDDKPVHSETAGPYACRPGQEIFGVVHLAAPEAAGKRLTFELVQSGGERRRFSLSLPYRF